MIENVTKSVKRKETIDDAYLEGLFEDMTSLYRLNQSSAASRSRTELGELPATAVLLLSALAAAWALILLYLAYGAVKKRKTGDKTH